MSDISKGAQLSGVQILHCAPIRVRNENRITFVGRSRQLWCLSRFFSVNCSNGFVKRSESICGSIRADNSVSETVST